MEISDLSNQTVRNMKLDLKEEFSPYIGLIVLPTFAVDITLVCIAYKMRLRIESSMLAEKEFDNCQQTVNLINVMMCGGMIGHPTLMKYYKNPFTNLLLAVSRLIAAILATPFLMLYRRNEVTLVQYFQRRFKSTLFTHIYVIIGMLLLIYFLNYSLHNLFQSINSFGSDPYVCLTILLTYSAMTTALGGLRGVIWIGAFRFYIIFIFQVILVIICSVKVSAHKLAFSDLGKEIKGSDFNVETFTSFFTYYLTVHFSVTISKYVNAVSKDSHAWWSSYLFVIPHVMLTSTMDAIYILAHLYYYNAGCDPIAEGAVARHMLIYKFLSDIAENAASLQLLFGFCDFWIGSFVVLDVMMTAWYLLSYQTQRMEKLLLKRITYGTSRFHILIMGASVIASFYAMVYQISEKSFFWWIPFYLGRVTTMSAFMLLMILCASALFPQMSSLTLWIIPLQLCVTLVVTLSSGGYMEFGIDYGFYCTYQNNNCTVPCDYPCVETAVKKFMLVLMSSVLLAIFGTIVVSYFSRKSYRNLDQDLYIRSAIKYWTRRYLRRKKKFQRSWITFRKKRIV